MEEKQLFSIISDILTPFGFKKKGRHWILDKGTIVKVVNLQKSNFSNSFYVNYGYIIKALPLDRLKMHVYKRLSSKDGWVNDRISQVLDLEYAMIDNQRISELNNLLFDHLVNAIRAINTESDLRNEMIQAFNMNQIPASVKNYLELD